MQNIECPICGTPAKWIDYDESRPLFVGSGWKRFNDIENGYWTCENGHNFFMSKERKKVALVTGSTRGIGEQIAITLAKGGYTVILNARNENGELLKYIKKYSPMSDFIKADVSDFDDCKKMAKKIENKYSGIDVLVNNAGIVKDKTFEKMTKEEWDDVINTNLNSLYNVTNNMLPIMRSKSKIINISSIVGDIGNFGQTNYSASKAGMIGFTKSLSKELKKRNIYVSAILPGLVKTEMMEKIPHELLEKVMKSLGLDEILSTEDVADEVYRLCKIEKGEIVKLYKKR